MWSWLLVELGRGWRRNGHVEGGLDLYWGCSMDGSICNAVHCTWHLDVGVYYELESSGYNTKTKIWASFLEIQS